MRTGYAWLVGGLLLLWLSWAEVAQAETPPAVEGLLERLDFGRAEAMLSDLEAGRGGFWPQLNVRTILADLAAGRTVLDPRALFSSLGRFLGGELLASARVMGQLVVLAVLCAVLHNLQAAFERRTVGEIAYLVVLLALLVLALGSFSSAMQIGREAVDRMTVFMQALLPGLLTILTAMGGMASSAIVHPLIMGCLALGGTLVRDVVLPLLFLAAALNIVGRVSERFQVTRLADTLKSLAVIALGLFITLAVGIITVQGAAAGAVDSLTLRTAKFASTAFVPVIGKTLTDAVEAVASASLLVQSAAGLLGVVGLLGLALFPALKIGVLALIFHLTAALVQPFGDNRISDALAAMGGTLGLAFAVVLAVALFFFLALSVLAGLGNLKALWW
ncbi:MAG: stage III sporulation protein AE [Clostridia bacterium]|jgi:stage III sporulation protein AE|nr:stage III sporulation protein AE [Clostridia bacterium]MDH7572654.1 stage III sporulation protein AE [Clostridia bacterium]